MHQTSIVSGTCFPQAGRLAPTVETGDQIVFEGKVTVKVADGQLLSRPFVFDSARGAAIDILAGPVDLVITGGSCVSALHD
jgi:hypothetical protein